ncbi:hypothetical protein FOA52_000394 [Chlamydomonas sp. UWO 241]|nr:hypothetical protein FOA52_000394 [Chlamydomonas sp. UWO 241]
MRTHDGHEIELSRGQGRRWIAGIRVPSALLLLLLALAGAAFSDRVLGVAAEVASKCAGCKGTCMEELGRCDCPRGYTGYDCSVPPDDPIQMCKKYVFKSTSNVNNCTWDAPLNNCLNNCNKRGMCTAGWCHCNPGYYGMDCSLSLDPDGKPELLAGLGYTLRKRRPSVYVYELPPRFNAWFNIRMQDRPLAFMLHQRLLSAGARTPDGDSADYYLIPMTIRGPSESMWLVDAIEYIRETWPWWDKHGGGARHLVVHTGDVGRMDAAGESRKVAEKSIWLTHWGLTDDYAYSGWKASHRPGLDIVVPIHISPASPRAKALVHSPLHPRHPERHGAAVEKTIEVLFAGRICGGREDPNSSAWPNCPLGINKGYSQGVRQLVHYHHWNRTGFSVKLPNSLSACHAA